jgi:phosphoglycolate phosphatase
VRRYDLVLFDLDGTLIDSVGDIADALNFALAAHGLPQHSDGEVALMVGNGVTDLVRRGLGPSQQSLLEPVIALFRRRYAEVPVARTRIYPGVPSTLAALAGRARLAVATNKPGPLARVVVERLELAPHFFAVLGEDDVGRRKPDPRVVELLRAQAGDVARERTLYVGDSLTDVRTAAAAEVDCCLVSYGYEEGAALAAAAVRHRIERFEQLLEIC